MAGFTGGKVLDCKSISLLDPPVSVASWTSSTGVYSMRSLSKTALEDILPTRAISALGSSPVGESHGGENDCDKNKYIGLLLVLALPIIHISDLYPVAVCDYLVTLKSIIVLATCTDFGIIYVSDHTIWPYVAKAKQVSNTFPCYHALQTRN